MYTAEEQKQEFDIRFYNMCSRLCNEYSHYSNKSVGKTIHWLYVYGDMINICALGQFSNNTIKIGRWLIPYSWDDTLKMPIFEFPQEMFNHMAVQQEIFVSYIKAGKTNDELEFYRKKYESTTL